MTQSKNNEINSANSEIYMDNSATTRPYDEVLELMYQVSSNSYGNPSSLHKKGIEAERLVIKARETIADSLRVQAKEIIFTSAGTESNNLAIRGYLAANPRKGRHIITSRIEHPSVLEVFKALEEEEGYEADYLDVDSNGKIDIKQLKEKINEETALISIMLINNETGAIQPIEELVEIRDYANKDTVIHVDAVQAYGKLKFYPSRSGVDMLSISSHKIHGPKGMGALYASQKIRLKPLFLGGGQESMMRSGTENVPGICGFGLASEMAYEDFEKKMRKVTKVNKYFKEKLSSANFEYEILSPEDASPFILNVSFPGLRSEVLLHHLEEKDIFVSTGSACHSRKNSKSHVLTAMNLAHEIIDSAIRFSFSAFNNEEEVDTVIAELEDIIPKILIRKR